MIESLLNAIQTIGYPAFALAMLTNIGSELFLPFAGFLVSLGNMNLRIAIVIGGVASYIWSIPLYLIGRWDNEDKIHNFVKKYGKYMFINTKEVDTWFAFFNKYGATSVFFGRLVPVVRAAVSFPAGAVKMPFVKYSIITILWDTTRSALLIILGYTLGENYTQLQQIMHEYQLIIIPILLLLVCIWIGRKVYRKWKNK